MLIQCNCWHGKCSGDLPPRILWVLQHPAGSWGEQQRGMDPASPPSPREHRELRELRVCRSTEHRSLSTAWAPQAGQSFGPCVPAVPGQQRPCTSCSCSLLHREGIRFPYCSTKAALLGRCGWGLWCSCCQTPAFIQTQVQKNHRLWFVFLLSDTIPKKASSANCQETLPRRCVLVSSHPALQEWVSDYNGSPLSSVLGNSALANVLQNVWGIIRPFIQFCFFFCIFNVRSDLLPFICIVSFSPWFYLKWCILFIYFIVITDNIINMCSLRRTSPDLLCLGWSYLICWGATRRPFRVQSCALCPQSSQLQSPASLGCQKICIQISAVPSQGLTHQNIVLVMAVEAELTGKAGPWASLSCRSAGMAAVLQVSLSCSSGNPTQAVPRHWHQTQTIQSQGDKADARTAL